MAHSTVNTVYPRAGVDSPPESLDELYADYRERLLHFVMSKVGVDNHAAEDIVQEAFAAALMSLAGFQSRSSPYTWLCSIAQHKIADYYRKRPPTDGSDYAAEDPDCRADPAEDALCSSVEQWFETMETRDMVRNALHELPSTYREVLRMKYFDGLSVVEIGDELGRSSKSVEGLLARARRCLSRGLSDKVPA